MAKLLDYNATVIKRIDLEPTLSVFQVRPDVPFERRAAGSGWFEPGQYLTIGLNRDVVEGEEDSRPVSVRRPMSIASAPEQADYAEFYIRKVGTPESDLPLTHLMWSIKEGERMYCRPNPAGKFTLADTCGDDDGRLKVTLAAGTGLAPFLSMARSRILRDPQARLDDFAVLHGASYPSSLGYADELHGLARDRGLKYLPTVSRPQEAPDWSGFEGRAEALFGDRNLPKTEEALGLGVGGLRPDKAVVLICGLQGTIANALVSLMARGFVPDNRRLRRVLEVPEETPASVFWEQYDSTPVLDVKDEALMAELRTTLHAAMASS